MTFDNILKYGFEQSNFRDEPSAYGVPICLVASRCCTIMISTTYLRRDITESWGSSQLELRAADLLFVGPEKITGRWGGQPFRAVVSGHECSHHLQTILWRSESGPTQKTVHKRGGSRRDHR